MKDTTVTAQFKVLRNAASEKLFDRASAPVYFLAWTTTPWTLPSNTALCVGPNIEYVRVESVNPYTKEPAVYVLAKALVESHFNDKNPFRVLDGTFRGRELAGIGYEQLFLWVNPGEGAFRVITGDYVTTEDGTGVVHIAPTFGADDDKVAKAAGVPPMQMVDAAGNRMPMVDRTGKFFRLEDLDPAFVAANVDKEQYGVYAGRYVKNAYDATLTDDDATLDIDLCVDLKQQGKAFRIEKHVHSYPHCWRTDKPVLY